VRATTLQTPRSVKKGRGRRRRCFRHWSRDSPAARDEDHGEAGCPSAAHGGPQWSRCPPAACGGPPQPKEVVTLWKAHAGAGSWKDLWRQRSSCWSRFAGRTCEPVGDPRWSSLFLKDCTQWEGPMLEQFVKNCSLWEGLMLEKLMESSPLWEGPFAGAGEESEEFS